MKLQRRTVTVEARQWDPEHPDGTNLDELLAWGAPVLLGHGGHLSLSTSTGQTHVAPGDWIMRCPTRTRTGREEWSWSRVTDAQLRREYVEEDGTEGDPVPGMQHVRLDRVAFRRPTPTGWEHRQDGLTRAELRSGGWEALYALSTPE